jgi:hypothetical protein
MAQEIYHRSNWGIASNEWGSTYLNADLTNELYKRAGYYENSWATDKILNKIGTKPSIIMTPTAYKDGKLNSVKPAQVIGEELVTNGDFSDGGTDWINTDGSAIFENGYVKIQSQGSTLNRIRQIDVTQVGKTFKLSYEIIENNNVSEFKYYNGTGYVTTTSTVGTHTVYFVAGNNNDLFFNVADANTDDYIIIDNVSLKEVINADFDFTRGSSATRVNEKGLIEITDDTDLPRINYKDGEGSLLLEPQSTNLVTYSEDFTGWGFTGALKTLDNNIISPNGNSGVQKLTAGSGSGFHFTNFSITISGKNSFSVFLKKGTTSQASMFLSEAGNYGGIFDLENGLVESVSGSDVEAEIIDYGSGWYRCILKHTSTDDLNNSIRIGVNNGALSGFNANGDEAIYMWGAQLEALSYATSYIPTNGTTVTRLADVANNAGNADLINSTEGVLYAEISALADDGTTRRLSMSDGSNQNRIVLMYHSTSNVVRVFVVSNWSSVSDMTYMVSDTTQFSKIAFSYKQNDFKLWIDGVQRTTDDSGATPTGLKELAFDDGNGSANFYGNVKSVAVFKEALSDEELQKLTSPYESFEQRVKADGGDIESLNCIPRTYR